MAQTRNLVILCQKRRIFVISLLEKLNFQAVIKSAASAASRGTADHVQKLAKHAQNTPKSQKSGFEPKVKSPKMGLSITPRQFL